MLAARLKAADGERDEEQAQALRASIALWDAQTSAATEATLGQHADAHRRTAEAARAEHKAEVDGLAAAHAEERAAARAKLAAAALQVRSVSVGPRKACSGASSPPHRNNRRSTAP